MRRRQLVRLGLALALIIAVGCSVTAAPHTEGIALTDAIKQTLKTLPHLRGTQVTDTTFAQKVVVVTFFASWCHPCREEFAHLRTIHEQYHTAGVEIIAVNLFEDFDNLSDETRLMTYLRLTQPPFTVVKGNEAISQHFGTVTRIPTLYVFDRQGQRALRFVNTPDGRQPTLGLDTLRNVITSTLARR